VRIEEYLERLGCASRREPSPENLRALQRAHLERVPFENLDIHLGRPIALDLPALHDKIVRRRRGGFCYELNGLFAWLLGELGYRVTLLSGRVLDGGRLGPEFDHLALLVEHEGRWLVDVGFGDSFLEPLALEPSRETGQPWSPYWLEERGGVWRLVRRRDGEEVPQYQFTLAPRRLEDFAAMCRHHQTSPDSHFTRNVICSLALPQGRVTYSSGRLILTDQARRLEVPLTDWGVQWHVLSHRFGIELSSADVRRLLRMG
jgi:N-hydroxyarylamine O-acetyltransferase